MPELFPVKVYIILIQIGTGLIAMQDLLNQEVVSGC